MIDARLSIIRQLRHQVIECDDDEDAGFECQYERQHATGTTPPFRNQIRNGMRVMSATERIVFALKER